MLRFQKQGRSASAVCRVEHGWRGIFLVVFCKILTEQMVFHHSLLDHYSGLLDHDAWHVCCSAAQAQCGWLVIVRAATNTAVAVSGTGGGRGTKHITEGE